MDIENQNEIKTEIVNDKEPLTLQHIIDFIKMLVFKFFEMLGLMLLVYLMIFLVLGIIFMIIVLPVLLVTQAITNNYHMTVNDLFTGNF